MDTLCKCCHGLFRRFIGSAMKKGCFVITMRAVVNFLNFCPSYVATYQVLEFVENEMDRFIFKFLLNAYIFMALVSYWTASMRMPKKIPALNQGN